MVNTTNTIKTIKIHNIRLGMATNSSSSHSFIFIPKEAINDYMKQLPEYNGEEVEGEYGWDYFTLDSAVEKQTYLSIVLRDALNSLDTPENIQKLILKDSIGVIPTEDSYIDHQSFINLPRDYHNQQFVDIEFFQDLRDFVLQPGMIILGGNDNDGEKHWMADQYDAPNFTFDFADMGYNGGLVARKDHQNNTWTLFNRDTGAKIRFSFEDYLERDSVESRATRGYFEDGQYPVYMTEGVIKHIVEQQTKNKAFAPELIDIKITDYCPYGCEFCYMGSTKEGKHASYSILTNFIEAASKLKVFEIAFGGGEPTLHPDFVRILKYAKEKGITPNFTTRNLAWLKQPEQYIPIIENMGAFAYSVSNVNDIRKLNAAVDFAELEHNRVNLHVVMGLFTRYNFENILKEAKKFDFRVTLLGYKESGFGEEFKKSGQFVEYDWWLESLVSLQANKEMPQVSIDTILATQYEKELVAMKIPPYMYYTQDGKFSAYFDAVNLRFAPASYVDTGEMIQLETTQKDYRGSTREKYYSGDDFKDIILKYYKVF